MPSILQTVERRGSWICLCPPKSVEFSEGGRLQRALHTLELQAALHEIDFGGRSREYIILAGGGLVVEASGEDGPSCAQFEDDTMAVFTGVLTNYGESKAPKHHMNAFQRPTEGNESMLCPTALQKIDMPQYIYMWYIPASVYVLPTLACTSILHIPKTAVEVSLSFFIFNNNLMTLCLSFRLPRQAICNEGGYRFRSSA